MQILFGDKRDENKLGIIAEPRKSRVVCKPSADAEALFMQTLRILREKSLPRRKNAFAADAPLPAVRMTRYRQVDARASDIPRIIFWMMAEEQFVAAERIEHGKPMQIRCRRFCEKTLTRIESRRQPADIYIMPAHICIVQNHGARLAGKRQIPLAASYLMISYRIKCRRK